MNLELKKGNAPSAVPGSHGPILAPQVHFDEPGAPPCELDCPMPIVPRKDATRSPHCEGRAGPNRIRAAARTAPGNGVRMVMVEWIRIDCRPFRARSI